MTQRILIVDDDVNIRSLLRTHLEKANYDIAEAEHGVAASKWLDKHTIDLVILDVVMPEMDGIEFAYEVKRRFPDMPILAMSAGELIMSKELCLEMMECLGAVVTIPKPFDIDPFLKTIEKLLAPKTPSVI